MLKYITVSEFIENTVREARNFKDWRIISIGHNSDGEYVLHIRDEYEHNREIRVPCWEGKK
jgi:hypothetical protein